MDKKFEKISLNKSDHKKAEKQADLARGVLALGAVGVAIMKLPWKNIKDVVKNCIKNV